MKIRDSVRRADWLRELHALLVVAAIGSALVSAAVAIAALTGQPFDIHVPMGDVLRPDAMIDAHTGAAIHPDAMIYLPVEHPTLSQRVLVAVAALPIYALTTIMLVMLWRLVGEARRTDPFAGVMARRLRLLGWLLVIGGPVAWATEFAARFALSATVSTGGANATLNLGTPAIWGLVGFGLLAISEVVRRGQAMRAELDEVV